MCSQERQLIIVLVICACILFEVCAETFAECNSPDKFNLYVASETNCAHYIYCDGEDSFMGECLDDNYFNEVAGNCDDRAAVVCKVGMNNNENEHQLETTVTSNILLEISSSESSNVESLTTLSSTTMFSTTVNPTNSLVSQTSNTIFSRPIELLGGGSPQCPRSSDPKNTIYLPNARTCSAYYICHYGVAIPMSCPAQFYFNALTGRCERQELVQCAVNRPARVDCIRGVYDFIPHPNNCEYYYFCANGFLMIFQCPIQFSWHYERKTCVHKSQMNCYSNTSLRQNGLW